MANVPFQVSDRDLLLQKHFLTFSLLFQFTLLKFFVDVFQRNVNPINLHQMIKHTPQLQFLACQTRYSVAEPDEAFFCFFRDYYVNEGIRTLVADPAIARLADAPLCALHDVSYQEPLQAKYIFSFFESTPILFDLLLLS